MTNSEITNKLWLVVRQDTIVQNTGYIVRAPSEEDANNFVDKGLYIEETPSTTMDTIDSETVSITEINPHGKEQEL